MVEGLSGMLQALSLTLITRDGVGLGEQWVFCPVVPGPLSCSFPKATCMIMVLHGWSNAATVSEMFAVSKRGTKKRNYRSARSVPTLSSWAFG